MILPDFPGAQGISKWPLPSAPAGPRRANVRAAAAASHVPLVGILAASLSCYGSHAWRMLGDRVRRQAGQEEKEVSQHQPMEEHQPQGPGNLALPASLPHDA